MCRFELIKRVSVSILAKRTKQFIARNLSTRIPCKNKRKQLLFILAVFISIIYFVKEMIFSKSTVGNVEILFQNYLAHIENKRC